MNTGSRDEQTMLANIARASEKLAIIADQMQSIARSLEKLTTPSVVGIVRDDQPAGLKPLETNQASADEPPSSYGSLISKDSNVLVQRFGDGTTTVSLRGNSDDMWGPPIVVRP